MSARAEALLKEIAQDWEKSRVVFTTDIERRLNRLANLGELMAADGSEEVTRAFFDTVALELASARLVAEAQVRAQVNKSVMRIVRFAVAVVAA